LGNLLKQKLFIKLTGSLRKFSLFENAHERERRKMTWASISLRKMELKNRINHIESN
jgi:hypothetical protein